MAYNFLKDAIRVKGGWADPITGEFLKVQSSASEDFTGTPGENYKKNNKNSLANVVAGEIQPTIVYKSHDNGIVLRLIGIPKGAKNFTWTVNNVVVNLGATKIADIDVTRNSGDNTIVDDFDLPAGTKVGDRFFVDTTDDFTYDDVEYKSYENKGDGSFDGFVVVALKDPEVLGSVYVIDKVEFVGTEKLIRVPRTIENNHAYIVKVDFWNPELNSGNGDFDGVGGSSGVDIDGNAVRGPSL